jgi:hypothetical protein
MKIANGLVLFSVLMALSLGVVLADQEIAENETAEEGACEVNATINETMNLTNATMNETMENVTLENATLENVTVEEE